MVWNESFSSIEGCYDYAVPEAGTMPLLSPEQNIPIFTSHINNIGSDISQVTKSSKTDGKKVKILYSNNVYWINKICTYESGVWVKVG